MEHLEKLATLHRYPMKSKMGEELSAGYIAQRGPFGDRLHALCDAETGKVVSANQEIRKFSRPSRVITRSALVFMRP